jgi:DNA polymerase-3 subunit epsilon
MSIHLNYLTLRRPLAILDLETTGTDPKTDRIVEISVLKLFPDGRHERHTRRLHPGRAIPPEATAVHHITDADVANCPKFEQVADRLAAYLDGCDLCGFNLKKFDLRMLTAEFLRIGKPLALTDRAIIDPMEIYHAYEPRDLCAAVRFYCGREHTSAHTAEGDVTATLEVLDAMLGRYAELPRDVPGLFIHFKDPKAVDASGHFHRIEGEIRFNFGKYRGQPLSHVARTAPDYLAWVLDNDFFDDTKAVIREALQRAQAEAPPAAPQPTVHLLRT